MVRTLIPEGNFPEQCKGSDEIKSPLSEDLIENSSSRPINNSIGMEFVLIPAGEFEMGSPSCEKRRKLWESPVHKVAIKKPFYLGRYPITQEQWQKVMRNNTLSIKNYIKYNSSAPLYGFAFSISFLVWFLLHFLKIYQEVIFISI